ncbi:hypothetical protein NCS57_01215600 [Fusarium keratoplasticum]|uniref:Uncharacterized protein n=1 Tax=Fusarium keratoplasticum TaxID=1328300 RepID=A0ACC0QJM3_9HYPO|nr:hypothetical protein NCS57_01215600 [Fusarium keratoplasticum]KAI8654687.1 hypothetical protein NCS57_01215600 [Fusarium keratoplasticum]
MGTEPQSSWRSLLSFFSVALFSLLVLLYVGPSRNSGLDLSVPFTERDLHDDAVTNLTKRASDNYEKAREKGARLHCLMAMSIEDAAEVPDGAQAAEYFESDGVQENEGWTEGTDSNAPYYRNYLDAMFSSLDISTDDTHHFHWVNNEAAEIHDDPLDWDGPSKPGFMSTADFRRRRPQPSGAFFTNSYLLKSGVIIADNNFAVKPAMDAYMPGWETNSMLTVTHLRRWSDAAWIQWYKACRQNGGKSENVKYIVRSRITNARTLSLIFEALISKFGGFPTIGRWGQRLTLDVEESPDEFHAVLGSPNGAGAAFLLLTHKEALGIKTINKVDIFVPNIGYPVVGTNVDDIAKNAKIMLLFTVSSVG